MQLNRLLEKGSAEVEAWPTQTISSAVAPSLTPRAKQLGPGKFLRIELGGDGRSM